MLAWRRTNAVIDNLVEAGGSREVVDGREVVVHALIKISTIRHLKDQRLPIFRVAMVAGLRVM